MSLDEVEEPLAAVLDALVLLSVGESHEEDRLVRLSSSAMLLDANSRIGDRVTHGVVEGSTAARSERLSGERGDFRDGEGIGEDLVRIVRIELDERHQRVRAVGLLIGEESVETSDDVGSH